MKEHEIKIRWRYVEGRGYEVEGVIIPANSPEEAIQKWSRRKRKDPL